jgi:hypothetical protein
MKQLHTPAQGMIGLHIIYFLVLPNRKCEKAKQNSKSERGVLNWAAQPGNQNNVCIQSAYNYPPGKTAGTRKWLSQANEYYLSSTSLWTQLLLVAIGHRPTHIDQISNRNQAGPIKI